MRAINLFFGLLIIVIACGMLVCGIVKIRESAALTRCSTNLRQIGLAVLNYESARQRFPLAVLPNAELPPERRLSWHVTLVPYVEATDLYSQIRRDMAWDAAENRFAAQMGLQYLRCPSFSEAAANSLAPTNYIGIAGLGTDAATLPIEDPRVGCFGYDRKLTFADLSHLASTFAVAMETARVSETWTAGGPPTVRGIDEGDLPVIGKSRPFGGTHVGGANVVFADWHVQFLRESIEPRILKALVTVHSKEEIGPLDD